MAGVFSFNDTGAGESIATVVRDLLGDKALPTDEGDTLVGCSAAVLIVVVECESDGTACTTARKFMRELKKLGDTPLSGKKVAVLAVASSVCAFSAASGGSDKFGGGGKLLKALLEIGGGEALVKLGCAEVEQEEVETSVHPWVSSVRAALDGGVVAASKT